MEKNKCQIINFQHHTKNLFTYQDTQRWLPDEGRREAVGMKL